MDILRETISSNTADISQSKLFYKAAISATSTIVFVAPAATLEVVMEMIHGDLDAQQLKGIGQQEVAIWHTPEDQVYVDGKSSQIDQVHFVARITNMRSSP